MRAFHSIVFIYVFICLTAQTLSGQSSGPVQQGISLERLAHLNHFVTSEIEQGQIPGAVTLVSRNGEIIYHEAAGQSDLSEGRTMQPDAIFYIQSMTKPIISVAFMMLYEEGHFMLTDPVSKYMPAFKELRVIDDPEDGIHGTTHPLESEITIAQLMSHTAGFTHGLGASRLDRELMRKLMGQPYPDIAARLDTFLTLPLIGQPGKQWYYSFAPDVLSVLIERFSGMPTAEFLQTRIFDPLGMTDTGYNLDPEQQERAVRLHFIQEDGSLGVSPNQPRLSGNTVWSGVNALYSTAADYQKFCQMLLNGGSYGGRQFLSPKTVDLMTMNHVGDLFDSPGHGFGLGFAVVTDVAETKMPGSEGIFYWSGAYNTHFFIDPKEETIALFMTQTVPHDIRFHNALRQLVFQAMVEEMPAEP